MSNGSLCSCVRLRVQSTVRVSACGCGCACACAAACACACCVRVQYWANSTLYHPQSWDVPGSRSTAAPQHWQPRVALVPRCHRRRRRPAGWGLADGPEHGPNPAPTRAAPAAGAGRPHAAGVAAAVLVRLPPRNEEAAAAPAAEGPGRGARKRAHVGGVVARAGGAAAGGGGGAANQATGKQARCWQTGMMWPCCSGTIKSWCGCACRGGY